MNGSKGVQTCYGKGFAVFSRNVGNQNADAKSCRVVNTLTVGNRQAALGKMGHD